MRGRLFTVDDCVTQVLFVSLYLNDTLFNGVARVHSVNKALFYLPYSPDSTHHLLIIARVPVWIKKDHSVAPDEIKSTASCLSTKEEAEIPACRGVWSIEFVN